MKLIEFWDNPTNMADNTPEASMLNQLGSIEARLAYKSGEESQQNGTGKEKCPYQHGERATAWLQGWKDSYFKKYGKKDVSSPTFPTQHPSSDAGSSNG
jgi:ribosome modulation factor